jgi:hypothetical protein
MSLSYAPEVKPDLIVPNAIASRGANNAIP